MLQCKPRNKCYVIPFLDFVIVCCICLVPIYLIIDKTCFKLRMTFTQIEKPPTAKYEKQSIVCFRPLIVVLFFTFKKVDQ